MFSLALIAALAAAAPADGMSQPRKAYQECLRKLVDGELAQKSEATKFETTLVAACGAEATALKSAIVTHYVSMKTPRKEAEQSATDWVTDLQETAKERYVSTLAAHKPPQ
jgi:hypothetical protein